MRQETKGRLQQGVLLDTANVRRWPEDAKVMAAQRERCSIYTNFSPLDEGRSRERVAEVYSSPEDARRLVACWNVCRSYTTEALERASIMPAGVPLLVADASAQESAIRAKLIELGWTPPVAP